MNKTKHRHHSDYDLYDDLAKIKAALREATQDVKGRASEILSNSLEDVEERSARMKAQMSDYIEEKPFKSLGLAMLAGLVIGYLIHK